MIDRLRLAFVFFAIAPFITVLAAPDPAAFVWPKGAGAAVCLTYDDAIPTQLDVAFPQLEAAGLKSTMFVTGGSHTVKNRLDDWRAVAAAGHELASHSIFHPCRKSLPNRDWVSPDKDLDFYTLSRMSIELDLTDSFLYAIDGHTRRTYAYPCGETVLLEGESFVDLTKDKYIAARGTNPRLDAIDEISFYQTTCFDGAEKTFEDFVAYLEDAYEKRTLAVIMFHGVGGDYLTVDGEAHRQLLEYLKANQDRFWVDTYQKVMLHARSEYERLGWDEN